MGKKVSDEQCLDNYNSMCDLFKKVVTDNDRFSLVYGCGIDVGMMVYVVVRTHTYSYSSYVFGYDEISKEIVVLPIAADLSEYGEPLYLKKEGLKKAKRSWWTKEFTIWHKALPKSYICFSVPGQINDDPDNVCLCVKQDEQAKKFASFFKEIYSK